MGFRVLNNRTGTIVPCCINKGVLRVAYDLRPPIFIPELKKLDFDWQCITWQETNIIAILRNNKYTVIMRQNGTISIYWDENGAIIKSFNNDGIMLSNNVINYSIYESLLSIKPSPILDSNKHTLLNFVRLDGWGSTDLSSISIRSNSNKLFNICDDTGMVNLYLEEEDWKYLLYNVGQGTSKMSIEGAKSSLTYKWNGAYIKCVSFTREWDSIFNDWRCI